MVGLLDTIMRDMGNCKICYTWINGCLHGYGLGTMRKLCLGANVTPGYIVAKMDRM